MMLTHGAYLHCQGKSVLADILSYVSEETAAMLVSQNPPGI